VSLSLPELPYALDALEPHVSRRTLAIHHGRHHAAYVEKTRRLVQHTPLASMSLEQIIRTSSQLQDRSLFNAAAQAWNHAFLWKSMRPGGGGEARGRVAELIEDSFGSQRTFGQLFVTVAGDQFGSGWAWVVLDGDRLRITATSNAETPLTTRQLPLLTVDLWEHAYYLDYQQRRLDYIAAFLGHLVDWEFANYNLGQAHGERTLEGNSKEAATGDD
jgi:Fe-Mn family superoxide dismutase